MAYFAHIDETNTVTTVIVAEQNFIDALVNSQSWVRTAPPNYAGIGYTYDANTQTFISPYVDPPPTQGVTGP